MEPVVASRDLSHPSSTFTCTYPLAASPVEISASVMFLMRDLAGAVVPRRIAHRRCESKSVLEPEDRACDDSDQKE